ncbi:hypothetical protein CEUSTIGMA_g12907.t1 [Chlamydomonas eustigma]|uniref:Dihydrolipoamide acetyltransferase component of pyruvate dehydrogenase complex n=1 Tax=Chlamydomonas eustigma TaxID=1157962 RepID=A0A250XQY3_9CHLO|nr:hypothetical protein CEUSTIGMA_g12907.t1 [Chlamydomonas eustigma]|eukprot:GAX85491.1 hypothetical protein CEUSTIGMA_g12907.t1 [Chlamydomonas eustigma]
MKSLLNSTINRTLVTEAMSLTAHILQFVMPNVRRYTSADDLVSRLPVLSRHVSANVLRAVECNINFIESNFHRNAGAELRIEESVSSSARPSNRLYNNMNSRETSLKRNGFNRNTCVTLQGRAYYGTVVSLPLAQTGEGISECELIQWFVKEGDSVAEFGRLCEVQSDKATIEITSRFEGRVIRLHHNMGDIVKVGASLVDMEVKGEAPVLTAVRQPSAEAEAATMTSVLTTAEHMQFAGIMASGGASEPCEPKPSHHLTQQLPESTHVVSLSSVQNLHMPAHEGMLDSTLSTTTYSHTPVQTPGTTVTSPVMIMSRQANNNTAYADNADSSTLLATPSVRSLAKQLGVDIQKVSGTGLYGRVMKEDVLSFSEASKENMDFSHHTWNALHEKPAEALNNTVQAAAAAAAAAGVALKIDSVLGTYKKEVPASGQVTVVPLRGYRRAMMKSMTAVASIPHFHYTDEINVDAIMTIRSLLMSDSTLSGKKLTLLPFVIKALSMSLLDHPNMNASLSVSEDSVCVHSDHNIGVAMASPNGLVVPNMKQVQNLSLQDVVSELHRLQTLAAANQLGPADVLGGTITVSNIGSVGGLFASPLVNAPEVAIVALGRTQKLPRLDEKGRVVGRSLLPVSWGADHRVVDGAGLAHLSNSMKKLLEEPARWLLRLR